MKKTEKESKMKIERTGMDIFDLWSLVLVY